MQSFACRCLRDPRVPPPHIPPPLTITTRAPRRSAAAAVPSVLPPSTTMTSMRGGPGEDAPKGPPQGPPCGDPVVDASIAASGPPLFPAHDASPDRLSSPPPAGTLSRGARGARVGDAAAGETEVEEVEADEAGARSAITTPDARPQGGGRILARVAPMLAASLRAGMMTLTAMRPRPSTPEAG